MKKVITVLLAVLLSACLPPARSATPQTPSNTEQFIGLCSNMGMSTEANKTLSIAACRGRVRGFVDGHMITVEVHKMDNPDVPVIKLWCVNDATSDQELLKVVTSWVVKNPNQYKEIVADAGNGITAVYEITMEALVVAYPCTPKKNG